MILTEKYLVKELRDHCREAKHRIWISSPFIGGKREMFKIIDGVWKMPSVDCKILTDAEAGFINKDSLQEFTDSPNVEVRSLYSLHAKVYIVDDWCLITSANLTGAAFSQRYEIGVCVDVKEPANLFMKWWNNATPINQIRKINFGIPGELVNYQNGKTMHFTKKCDLPSYKTETTDKFLSDCALFREFANVYERVTGRNEEMKKRGFPLYLEVDYFFNYLFHDAPGAPSNEYKDKPARKLSDAHRNKEILRYFKKIPFDQVSFDDRMKRLHSIQTMLAPDKIMTLTKEDVKTVLGYLHSCLAIGKAKILNNNKPKDILKVLDELLNHGEITSTNVNRAIEQLYSFGDSLASELIAWYKPDEFPIMNLNSRSGLRFFGVNIN